MAELPGLEPVDLEDCRTAFCAYNDRLAPTNLSLYEPLPLIAVRMYLGFMVPFARPGVEDLLPSMLGLTIDSISDWFCVPDPEATLQHIRKMPPLL